MAAAKRQVFGTVGIDLIAGPSEILVVADGLNDPRWIAADLLAQAEHDTLTLAPGSGPGSKNGSTSGCRYSPM